jgi:transcriptional regulator with XRE-family HTH domain
VTTRTEPERGRARAAPKRAVRAKPKPAAGASRPTATAGKRKPKAKSIDADVGARIRAVRLQRKLRLQQVALRTGLSIGFISQIERGISSPSLSALTHLADALDVSLSQLFDAPRPTADTGNIVVRTRSRSKLVAWRTGIYKQLLTADAPARFSFLLLTMEPGATSGTDLYSHHGEEAGLIMQGKLKLTVEGRTWTLARGDSFHFPSERPHRFENAARGKTVIAMLNLRRDSAVP